MLDGVGVSDLQEQIYRRLLRGAAGATVIAEQLGVSRGQLSREIATLRELGLVVRLATRPATYGAAQPDIALTALIHRREQGHRLTRSVVQELMGEFAIGARESAPGAEVEFLTATDSIMQRYAQLQLAAEEEVRIVDAPPHLVPAEAPNPFEAGSLARGVRWRVIYDVVTFEHSRKWQSMKECVAAGELARSLANVPAKMHISDRTLAMVFPRGTDRVTSAMVVHPSPLLDSLVKLFDLMWEQATPTFPVDVRKSSGLTDTEATVLGLLAAGEKDEAIARVMGVHVRTVRRHVRRLCAQLEAPSRFVAGIHATQRGWV
jgi:DNA-binding CsgD family transcriptional regulator/sugar-specific transcriptional regulator TrmB